MPMTRPGKISSRINATSNRRSILREKMRRESITEFFLRVVPSMPPDPETWAAPKFGHPGDRLCPGFELITLMFLF